jgi:hypothetical protein
MKFHRLIRFGPVLVLLFLFSAASTPAQKGRGPAGLSASEPSQEGGAKKSGGKKTDGQKKDAGKKDEEKKDEKKDGEPAEGDPETDSPGGTEKSEPASGPADSPDAAYVKANLKDFIHGTVSFSQNGTVSIEYDLHSKNEAYQEDFRPPISTRSMDVFRWSLYQEERVIGGDFGLRVSDKGASFLNLLFVDDLEATAEFLQGITWTKRQFCAVVFQGKGGKGIGNNYGGQCAVFAGSAYQGGKPATTETTVFNNRVKIGLKVRGGTYEALREGKPRASAKYSPQSFSSGRVGLIWGGNLAGTMISFSVKGKIDYPAMAKEMKKRAGGK